ESDVQWSGDQTFYILTDHNDFEVYTYDENTWGDLKLNDRLYIYTPDEKESYITDISMLKKFNDSYNEATGLANNYYRNTRGLEQKTRPNITGVMYINNDANHPIDEAILTNTYGAAFPNLKIFAKYITHSYVAKYVQKLDSGRIETIDLFRYSKQSGVHPGVTSKVPTKTNYDFVGWTEDPNYSTVEKSLVDQYKQQGIILTDDAITVKEFTPAKEVYTFYAVFAITAYTARFWNAHQNPEQDEPLATVVKDFGDTYENPSVLPVSNRESELGLTDRYAFIGWVADKVDCYPVSAAKANLVNLRTVVSQNTDRDFYACYVVEDVYTKATDVSYFDFVRLSGDEPGYSLTVKNNARLYGKITIPKAYQGPTDAAPIPIRAIGSGAFLNQYGITHIFFEPGSMVRDIGSSAFQYIYIRYFEPPTTLQTIGTSAFFGCSQLEYFDLPQGVRVIGQTAFNQAFSSDAIDKFYIPGSIRDLYRYAYQFHKANCTEIQFGGPNDPCDNINLNIVELKLINTNSQYQDLSSTYEDFIANNNYLVNYSIPKKYERASYNSTIATYNYKGFTNYKSLSSLTISIKLYNLYEYIEKDIYGTNIYRDYDNFKEELMLYDKYKEIYLY
ncbi:MAG: leucine-rich repeat protein, partial [Bacilli bacterium]|nr:leucine-rich repeat protein [Bacilli bacterium]